MYKDLTRYLKPDLQLKDKTPRGELDALVTRAYHAITKKSIIKTMDKIKAHVHMNGNYVCKSPSKIKQHAKQKQNALAICQFMLDNFAKRMRALGAMHSRNTVKRHADKYKYMGKLKGDKRALREPKWLSQEAKSLINAIYKEAKALRKGGLNVHVDHIIPLLGNNVSGLHVPENLEIVPALDNLTKHNKWEVA